MPGTSRSRWPLTLAGALMGVALASAACAPATRPATVGIRAQSSLVTQVVASVNDAGRLPSVALGPDGNPAVSYLLLKPKLAPSQLPPQVVANTAQPPAVVVATYSSDQGYWSRTSASQQDYTKAVGTDRSVANGNGLYLPGVTTGIAVDAQGKHHVIWATPSGLFYTDDIQGSPPTYAAPTAITRDAAIGGSIALASDGTPWVSYYDGNDVDVATLQGGTWSTQLVASVGNCASCLPLRTSIAVGANGPVVAFTDGEMKAPKVAVPCPAISRGCGVLTSGWTATDVGAGTGGFGLSMAVASDGTTYLAYYGSDGSVSLAIGTVVAGFTTKMIGGSTLPSGATGIGVDPFGYTTGVAADGTGKVYVTWTDPASGQVKLAFGSPASPATITVPQSIGGVNPTIAVTSDGKSLVLPFYDSVGQHLDVAVPAQAGAALAAPSPTPSPPPVAGGPPQCSPAAGVTALTVSAQGVAFNVNCLAVDANTAFTIAFTNNDSGIPHNVAIYENSGATKLLGGATSASDTITGPASFTYSVTALPAGLYFFRCDVHATQMFGVFVVGSASGSPAPGPSSTP